MNDDYWYYLFIDTRENDPELFEVTEKILVTSKTLHGQIIDVIKSWHENKIIG